MNKIGGKKGKVYLIGAGPGDPGLLTLRGKACIERADVIIYDHLASERLLAHARPSAEIICAGKRKGEKTLAQEQINRLMVQRASQGDLVARLKGGDPFIFGRGGEEAMALADAGIPFEVVPGVSSASGVPAYAGIPLTHRGYSAMVVLATGHEDPKKVCSDIPWSAIAPGRATLVFFMGITNLRQIVAELLENGRDPGTPVAIVSWGTHPSQETVVAPLSRIVEQVGNRHFRLPGMIIVGDVVRLREKLNWFERRPLFRKRVLVTRPQDQAPELIESLADLGAEPVLCPTIRIVAPANYAELDRAIGRLEAYDWVLFTSVNGVSFFRKRLEALGRDVRALGRARICTIGPKTADAVKDWGIRPDIIPEKYQAEGIIAEFERMDLRNRTILLPRAKEAREILPETLRRMGARVDVVTAYETVEANQELEAVRNQLESGRIDVVTFTSSSTVRSFARAFGNERLASLLGGVVIASIGPVTAQTVRDLGLVNHVLPAESTAEALAAAIAEYFETRATEVRVKRGERS